MKELIFIRHGSLPESCKHRLVGQNGTPLSETGIRDAEAVGRYLAELEFDAVFAGTLPRVRQTLETASASLAARAVADSRLNEVNFGDWCMRSVENLDAEDQRIFADWNFGNFPFSFPGGETMAEFAVRTRAALKDIQACGGERIAIFSHGGVIMSLLADLIGLNRSAAFSLWVERGAIARVLCPEDAPARLHTIGKPADWEATLKA